MLKKTTYLLILSLLLTFVLGVNVSAGTKDFYTLDLEKLPKYDFGGAKVVFAHDWRAPGEPEEGTAYYDQYKAVEEYYNVDVVLIDFGHDVVEGTMQRMMSGDQVDMVRVGPTGGFRSLVAAGILRPINDAFDGTPYYADFDIPEWIKDEMKVIATMNQDLKGNFLAAADYSDFSHSSIVQARNLYFFNKTILENEEIPDMYEIIDSGEWTWDKMLEIARKVTRDTDGNGVIDQFGLTKSFPNALLHANNASLWELEGNKPVFTGDDPAVLETVEFAQKIFEEGLTSINYTPDEYDKHVPMQHFRNGHVAFGLGEGKIGVAYIPGWGWWWNEKWFEDQYGVAPVPKGPNYEGEKYPTNPSGSEKRKGISVTSEFDTRMLLTLNYALYPKDENVKESLKEHYSQWAKDRKTVEYTEKYFLNAEVDLSQIKPAIVNVDVNFNELVANGEYVQYVQENKVAIQKELDELLK